MNTNVTVKPQASISFSENTAHSEKAACAYLDLRNPEECIVEKDKSSFWLTLVIEASLMDELALSWCRQRGLTAADNR